jgi:hypothetical protein
LAPGGRLLLETSAAQVPLTSSACAAAGFDVEVVTDASLDAVVVRALVRAGC